ncbi:MAG: metallophosphoesterase [Nitrospira bacterium SG8_35_4]|nr:MAG: metallophosphoesterase [Nitrospira bacterium SG8_35_4]
MILFFITFFTLYGLLHLYAFLKAKAALTLDTRQSTFIVLFMAAMTFAPAIIRYLERFGLEILARTMSYIGYLWMGILVLFFSLAVCIDIYRLVIYLSQFMASRDMSALYPSVKVSFFLPLLFALAAAGYGFFEAQNIRLEHITLKTSRIPIETGRFRIVQISDVHLGLIVRESRLKRIIAKVQEAGPDLLVCTGDLVDGQINNLEGLAEMLQSIQPVYGKFAITGNHEYYAGLHQALDFIRKAGFTILRGQAVEVNGFVTLAGVDDPTGSQFNNYKGDTEQKVLSGLDHEKYTILLKHRPLVDNNSRGLFDLQLSGHTHKGQIFPFSLLTKLYYPKHAGYLSLADSSHLYISRGSGTWGPPIRFLSPPEVTVIDLVREG